MIALPLSRMYSESVSETSEHIESCHVRFRPHSQPYASTCYHSTLASRYFQVHGCQ